MKKILLLIIVLLSFSLVSCNGGNDVVGGGNNNQQTPNKDPNNNTDPIKPTGPVVKEEFKVIFMFDGMILHEETVYYGEAVEPPYFKGEEYGVEFLGWDSDKYKYVTSDLVINAKYRRFDEEFFIVNFYFDGKLLASYEVARGESVSEPDVPHVEGKEFIGWSTYDFSCVESDLEVHALFKEIGETQVYTVNFYLADKIIYSTTASYGSKVEAPYISEKDYGVKFNGWDSYEFEYVTKDLDIHALYDSLNNGPYYVYLNIDGDIINPNNPLICRFKEDLQYKIYLEEYGYTLPNGYVVKWDYEGVDFSADYIVLFGALEPQTYQVNIYVNDNHVLTFDSSIENRLTQNHLLDILNEYFEADITLEELKYYVRDYQYILEMLDTLSFYDIYLYTYCVLEYEVVFYHNNEYLTSCFIKANELDSIIMPSDEEIFSLIGINPEGTNLFISWSEPEFLYESTICYHATVEEEMLEYTIIFEYNGKQVVKTYTRYDDEYSLINSIYYEFSAEEGYRLEWDFDLAYSREPQIVYPLVLEREYTVYFMEESGNLIKEAKISKSSMHVDIPQIPYREGYEGCWFDSDYSKDFTEIDELRDYNIILKYSIIHELFVKFIDYDNLGNIKEDIVNTINFTSKDILKYTFEEFMSKYNLDNFNLTNREYFDTFVNNDHFRQMYEQLRYMNPSEKYSFEISYGYSPIEYVLWFVVMNYEEGYGNHVGVSYNILTDISTLEIPQPGKRQYYNSTWPEFEFFKDTYQEVYPIETPINYILHFNDGITVRDYSYSVFEQYNNQNIKVMYDNEVIYEGSMYDLNYIQRIINPIPSVVKGYDGIWDEYSLFSSEEIEVGLEYVMATYNLELYVPKSVNSYNYEYYQTISYNIENYTSIILPEGPKVSHYNGIWDSEELFSFDEKNKVVNLKYVPIEYVYNFYLNNELYSSEIATIEKRVDIPYINVEAGYTMSQWHLNNEAINVWELELGNYDLYCSIETIKYTITYVDLEGKVLGTKEYDVKNPVTEHIAIPLKEGMVGKWGYWSNSPLLYPFEYTLDTLEDITLCPYYTSEGATEGLVYRFNTDYQNPFAYVCDYTGTSTEVTIPKIYNNVEIERAYLEEFSKYNITYLDMRHQMVYYSFPEIPTLETLIINDYSLSRVNYGSIKHLEVVESGKTTYERIFALPSSIETLKVHSKHVTFDNTFTNLVNLKYLELEGVKSTDYDNINTLTHEFELNFTDLYSYLIYDNTIEFKENIKVSINNVPLSTITEIVIPANLETILYNKFVNTNITKLSFEERDVDNKIYFYEESFNGIVELDLSAYISNNTLKGSYLKTVKNLTLSSSQMLEFDNDFFNKDFDNLYVESLDKLLSYPRSPLHLNDNVNIYINDELYVKKPYIIFEEDITKTNYDLSYFGLAIYKNKNIDCSNVNTKCYQGTDIYNYDEVFYIIKNNEAIAYYAANLLDSVILDNITLNNIVYPVTTLDELFLPKQTVKNLYLGSNITTSKANSFKRGHVENVYINSITQYIDIDREGDELYSTPTATGSNLYVDGNLYVEFISPVGMKSVPSALFYNCQSLKKVVLNEGVEYINGYAFSLTSLTDLYLPSTLKTIYYLALDKVEKVHLADLEKYVENVVFVKFMGLPNTISAPFMSGAKLYIDGKLITELVLPDTVTNIGEYVFDGLTGVSKLYVPDTVLSIGYNAFANMPDLIDVRVPSYDYYDNFFSLYTFNMTEYNGAYYFGNEANPYAYLAKVDNNTTDLVVHEDTLVIVYRAAFETLNLKTADLSNVKYIGNFAFESSSVEEVWMSSELKYVGYRIFEYSKVQAYLPLKEEEVAELEWNSGWASNSENKVEVIYDAKLGDNIVTVEGIRYYLDHDKKEAGILKGINGEGHIDIGGSITYNDVKYLITKVYAYSYREFNYESVTFYNGIVNIGQAFLNAPNLKSVLFGKDVVTFCGLSIAPKLEEVRFATDMPNIDLNVYAGLNAIIYLPKSVTNIKNSSSNYVVNENSDEITINANYNTYIYVPKGTKLNLITPNYGSAYNVYIYTDATETPSIWTISGNSKISYTYNSNVYEFAAAVKARTK